MAEEEVKTTETVETPQEVATSPETFAKSGKKSKKHIEEVKAEEERQARKLERKSEEAVEKPKGAKPIVRPLIERRGKKYQAFPPAVPKSTLYM